MRLQQQKSAAQFRADVDTLTEVAYQQGDSLKGVQDALKLVPQQSGWLTHDKAGNDPILSNPKVLAAAFSKDVLVKKHNSEPIDLGNNTMVVVRVLDHQPQHQLKLDEVKDAIKAELVSVEGAKLAAQRGQSMLDALKTGKPTGAQSWSPAHTVSRQSASGLPAADLRAIFSAGVAKLPAFAGVKHDNGEYVLYRVEQVIAAPAATPEQRLQLAGVVGEMGANVQAMAYLNGLRQKYPIKGGTQTINQEDQ
jgi:peptidyl-prolyl cis-trans isomerase D